MYRRKEPAPVPSGDAGRPDRPSNCRKAYLLGKGFAADVPGGVTAFLKSRAGRRRCPTSSSCSRRRRSAPGPISQPFKTPFNDGFAAAHRDAASGKPRARSRCARPIPRAHPRIVQNFLSTEQRPRHDAGRRPDGAATSPRRPRCSRSSRRNSPPAPGKVADAEIDAYIRAHRRSPCTIRSAPARWAGQRRGRRGRSASSGARRGAAAGGRRLGHARPRQRQHQRGRS